VPECSAPVERVETDGGQPQRLVAWPCGGELGGECGCGGTVVTQPGEHAGRGDTVGKAMVHLHQDGPPAVGQALDDPALPQRMGTVEPSFDDVCGESEQ